MIELALLGLLTEQDLHGYELKKQLGELLGSWSLSFGSLYPALARLEAAGLVEVVPPDDQRAADAPQVTDAGAPEPASPMTGALSGELAAFRQRLRPKHKPAKPAKPARAAKAASKGTRRRKVYRITAAGRDRCAELLTAPGPDDERSFAVRVAFCRQLEPRERLALFERRKAELVGQLASRRHSTDRRGDLYRRSLRDRDARAIGHDIEWVDELIAATRADAPSPRSVVAEAPTLKAVLRPARTPGAAVPSTPSSPSIRRAAPAADSPKAGSNP
jgi:DNA-binding PadR family transcriptional regulator